MIDSAGWRTATGLQAKIRRGDDDALDEHQFTDCEHRGSDAQSHGVRRIFGAVLKQRDGAAVFRRVGVRMHVTVQVRTHREHAE